MSGPVFNGDFLPSAVQTLADLKYLPTPQGVMHSLGSTSVGDGGGGLYYWDSTSTATSDDYNIVTSLANSTGRWKMITPTITLNAASYGVIPDGVTDNYSAMVAVIAKAQLWMQAYGKPVEIVWPAGDILVNNTSPIDINDGYRFRRAGPGTTPLNAVILPSMRGAGKFVTRFRPQVAGQALFRFYPIAALTVDEFKVSDFSIYGPGTGNSNTVGIYLGGVSTDRTDLLCCQFISNLHIATCATGIRLDDSAGAVIQQLFFDQCGYGMEFGYNVDILTINQCHFWGDILTPLNIGVGISCGSWTPPHNSFGNGNAIILTNCVFGLLVNCIDLQAADETGFFIHGGYAERVNKFAKLGSTPYTSGVKNFVLKGMHFSQPATATYGLTSAAIEVLGTGTAVDPYIVIKECRGDQTITVASWLKGSTTAFAGQLDWQDNLLACTFVDGPVSWGGTAVSIGTNGQSNLNIGKTRKNFFINSTIGTTPANLEHIRVPAAGRIFWQAAGADSSHVQAGMQAQVIALDAGGAAAIVAFEGAFRVTPLNSVARPTAGSAYRGLLWSTQGAGGVADTLDFCLKNAADAYVWGSLQSGTYTPTLTAGANVAASTARVTQFMRVGNTVTVAGELDLDATTTLTNTVLGISLPITSAFANTFECGGTAVGSTAGTTVGQAGRIYANVANDRAELQVIPVIVTNDTYSFTFTYQVI